MFIENHVNTYCPKCNEKRPVAIRMPKCLTCGVYLRYQCEKCLKSYAQYNILRQHLKDKHLLEPTHKCKQCGKIFILLKDKNQHQKVCITPPKLCCNFFPYRNSYKFNLSRHIQRKHPGK